jgi:NADH-quinone oxidoreductase subunit A
LAGLNIDLFPLIVYGAIAVAIIVAFVIVSALLGEKRKYHASHEVYESGVLPQGSPQIKLNVPFYLTAILFIIFDLEAVFLFAWAISIREAGWVGFIEVFIFIAILVAGLIYLWRSGALEWRTQRQQHDLHSMKGEGGVVNIRNGRKIVEVEADSHDEHGHGGHH